MWVIFTALSGVCPDCCVVSVQAVTSVLLTASSYSGTQRLVRRCQRLVLAAEADYILILCMYNLG